MNCLEFHDLDVSYPAQRIPSLKEWVLRSRRIGTPRVTHALREVSFSVEEGESLGVIGGNGAGKSTLLRVAAGIIPPSRGEVIARGLVAPIVELATGFDGELSGRENIFFNGSLLGRSRAYMRRCCEEIIDFSGLTAFIDAPLRTYSTGMVARLAFAVATTIDADLVILDEVLSVGDGAFREQCNERIRRFHARGATLLLVSHDLTAIQRLCAKAVWIDQGRMRALGPTDEVTALYADALTHTSPTLSEATVEL